MDDAPLIRLETPGDRAAVLAVIADAFDEPGVDDLWAELAQREGTSGFVAELDGAVVGHVGLSRAWVDASDRLVDVLVLSPLSVAPDRQGRGIGRALVERATAAAIERAAPVLFLEGDPGYYSRLGFDAGGDHGFTAPSVRIPGPAFQCVLLPGYEPSVRGALVYPDTFWRHDAVGLRGERLDAVLRALGD
jgi:putative acetyltransferase